MQLHIIEIRGEKKDATAHLDFEWFYCKRKQSKVQITDTATEETRQSKETRLVACHIFVTADMCFKTRLHKNFNLIHFLKKEQPSPGTVASEAHITYPSQRRLVEAVRLQNQDIMIT